MNRGLAEKNAERRLIKLAPQLVYFVDQEFQALDLNFCARKTVEDDAVAIFGPQQFFQQDRNDLAVADHAAGILYSLGLRRIEQRAHHDWRAGEAAGLGDEGGVGAFAGARRTTQ